MHECVKKLVDYEGVPDEAEVESLTSLLRTIGASLDASEKGHAFMDAYFQRIHLMVQTPNLPSRLRFMLLVSCPSFSMPELNTNVSRISSICVTPAGNQRILTRAPRLFSKFVRRYVQSNQYSTSVRSH